VRVQSGSYISSANSTSHTVTFGSTPAAGNTVIVAINSDGTISTPSGWTKAAGNINFSDCSIFYRQNVPASMTSVAFTINANTSLVAWYEERDDLGTAGALDKTATGTTSTGSPPTIASGTTAATVAANEYLLAAFGWPWGATADDIVSYSNSFTSAFSNHNTVGARVYLGVASKTVAATGTQTTTATVGSGGDGNPVGVITTWQIQSAAASLVIPRRGDRGLILRPRRRRSV
jgi:hypothetical protein